MQIKPVSNLNDANRQSFQGKIVIDSELSYLPTKFVRQAYNSMSEMIKDKEYDLFIRQVYPENRILMTAQREKDLLKGKKLNSQIYIDNHENITKDYYEAAAEYLVKDFDNKLSNLPETFGQKCKKFFDKLGNKILKIVQDEDEI